MDSTSPYAFEVVPLTLTLTFCLRNTNLKTAIIFGYQQILNPYTYVMKKTKKSKDLVEVENKSKLPVKPEDEASAGKSTSFKSFAEVKLERVGRPGIQEKLGNFERASRVSFALFFNCVLLGLSTYLLIMIELSDHQWQHIIHSNVPFPSTINATKQSKNLTYFEGRKLRDLEIGRLIYLRKDFKLDEVDFGMDRETKIHLVQVGIMLVICIFCVIHLLLSCCLRRIRRNFQLISLAYGFVGLFTFCLCITTLYFAFVHKVASYLENGMNAPKNDDVKPPVDNQTVQKFMELCFSCGLAFSVPNQYAMAEYSKKVNLSEDASFSIENMENITITYNRREMMHLGICPRQDYLLAVVFVLAVTSVSCWLVASYSETLENRILGPPIWLTRFKVKIHKGIRHWHTRKKIPSYLNLQSQKEEDENRDRDREAEDMDHGDHPNMPSPSKEIKTVKIIEPPQPPIWFDAYDILDGGFDHIILTDPFSERGASSNLRLYRSMSEVSVFVERVYE